MNRITILSNTAFWFTGAPFEPEHPGSPDTDIFENLCTIYKLINPDIICLQEIQDEDTFKAVSSELDMTGTYCEGQELTQYGGTILWSTENAVPIKTSVDMQRMQQIIKVKNDMTICNIHLPSDRQLGPEKGSEQRIAELQTALTNNPDIIMGDFNEYETGPVYGYMRDHGYADAAVIANKQHLHTNIGDKRGDYIWIRNELRNCLVEYNVTNKADMEFAREETKYLSDHLPLYAVLEI